MTLRRRLAVAFVLTAGIAAGALAIGTTLVVTTYRARSFRDRAYVDARRALAPLEANDSRPPERVTGGPEVLLVRDTGVVATSPDLTIGHIPARLRRQVNGHVGAVEDAPARIGSRRFTVVGMATTSTPEAYFFFSRDDLDRSVREFRLGVWLGWLIVVAIAAAVGTAFARRVLRPV